MRIDRFARVGAATLAAGLTLAGPHAAVAAADTGSDADTAAPAHSRTAAGQTLRAGRGRRLGTGLDRRGWQVREQGRARRGRDGPAVPRR